MILPILLAQTQTGSPGAAASPGGGFNLFVLLIFLVVIFYFILIRPQSQRQKELQKLIGALKTGDRVVTNAEIHGLIPNVKDSTVIVKFEENFKIDIEQSIIYTVCKLTD